MGNVLVIGLGASLGVIVIFAGIHLLAGSSLPIVSPAAQGLQKVITYGKAA